MLAPESRPKTIATLWMALAAGLVVVAGLSMSARRSVPRSDSGSSRLGSSLNKIRGPAVISFLCGCPACQRFCQALRRAPDVDATQVAVTSLSPADAAELIARRGFAGRLVYDPEGRTALAFGVNSCPSVVVIDSRGRVVYRALGISRPYVALKAIRRKLNYR